MDKQFWKTIQNNPVYLREKGRWGEPNKFFATLNRNSPLIIIGALVLGLCCGFNSLPSFVGIDDSLIVFWFLICLPNIALQALTWAGIILAPSLTAPSVSEEINKGTWDILRLTPQPMSQILFAKVLGSLSRLKIWWPLLIFSILQAGASAVGILASTGLREGPVTPIIWAVLLGIGLILRPWAEIGFAALIGAVMSTWASSARTALVGSYISVIGMKILNGPIWLLIGVILIGSSATSNESIGFVISALGTTIVYMVGIAVLALLLVHRADRADAWATR